jgi:hypothetical protein
MRSLAVLVSLSLAACFPHNHKARTISKVTEGAMLVGGITLEYFANTNADCAQMMSAGCQSHETLGNIGVALILAGLAGFAATVSTDEDPDDPPAPVATQPAAPREAGQVKLPPGVVPAQR